MTADLPSTADLQALLRRAASPSATPADLDATRRAADAHFAACQDRIYWLCLRLAGRPEFAAELMQEAMLTAWQRLPEFRGESSFYAWLYSIARYTCLRARARRQDALDGDDVLDRETPGHNALALLRQEERDRLLDEACRAALDPIEQEAIVLRYTMGLGYDELTELLGLTNPSGARAVLQASKRKLRPELERRLARLGHGHSLVLGSIGTDE